MTASLLALLSANRLRGAGLRCEAGAGAATVYLYDVIGPGGVEAAEAVKAIAAIDAPAIELRLNSPGGDVFEARAIKTALERHPARVTAHVDGLAASAASFLMLAADEIRIAPGAFVMIHNPWGVGVGDARELRATADLLDQVGAAMIGDYARKTGLPRATIAAMMDAETWLEASEAVRKGFADRLMSKPDKPAAAALKAFDLSAYAHAPRLPPGGREAPAAPEDAEALEASRQRAVAKWRLLQ